MSGQKTLGSLLVRLGMTDREAAKAIKSFEKKLRDLKKNVETLGKQMSIGFTAPFILAMKKSIENYNIQEQAVRRLQVATGGQTQALLEQASAIQRVTTFGDEQIITQQAFLASLGLTEETIKDVTQGAVNLSAALGISLESATKNLAKTTAGMTGELGELIPGLKQFSAEQLKSGAAIKYANEQFAGFAEAAALVGTGPLQQMQNSLGDLTEQFGKAFLPVIVSVTTKIRGLIDTFQGLTDEQKRAVVGIGALVAAIGPLLLVLPKVIKVIGFMLSPLGLLTAAIIALGAAAVYVAYNWERFAYDWEVIWFFVKKNAVDAINFILDKLNTFLIAIAALNKTSVNIIPHIEDPEYKNKGKRPGAYKSFGQVLTEAGTDLFNLIGGQDGLDKIAEAEEKLNGIVGSLDKISGSGGGAGRRISDVIDPIATLATNTSISFGGETEDPVLKGMKAIEGDPTAKWKAHTEALDKYKNTWLTLGEAIGGAVESMGQALAEGANFFAAFGKAALKAAAQVAKAALVEVVANAMAAESKKGLPGILIGAAAGIAGISILENLISNVKTPKLAEGAMIFGPTRAIVGDNPNVQNDPEVVSPLSKLKGMLGDVAPQNINVTGILNGDHIYLASVKAHERSVRRGSPNGFLSDIITY